MGGSFIFSLDPFASHIRWYGRYIDDILLKWEGTGIQDADFVTYINSNSMNLAFTSSYDSNSMHFLDVTGDRGILISPYGKNAARNSTLLATSCHPEHVIDNVPFGE